MQKTPLGEILLRSKLITETQLAHALALQQKGGGRLGDILIGNGMIGYLALYRALAAHYQLPFVDLLREPPEPGLTQETEADTYLKLRAMPWRWQDGQTCIAITDISDDTMAWIKRRFTAPVRIVITSPLDIRRSVERLFGHGIEQASRLSLWEATPSASARFTVLPRQREILRGLLVAALASATWSPIGTVLGLLMFCQVSYGITMLFKYWMFAQGTRMASVRPDWKTLLASLDERTLPVYTVLVPMYQEAASLPGLLDALQRLDYPAAKLDIKLVLEADDTETLSAAHALKPRYQFNIICVPPASPRTKPRACNYALRFARGDYVTVFDADDRPERLQLKKAVYTFRNCPADVACLQAHLNYYNAGDNLLTRFFSLEYAILFRFMLYGLEHLGIPIPLGGTSNHIAIDRLKAVGAWDPYNVTEDADLGVRLTTYGFRTAMFDSHTMEEAPVTVMAWIRQRSRWIKGYMQTWLVHMRHPAILYRTLGPQGFTGFQLFIGFSCFAFLTGPLVWLLSLLWVGQLAHLHDVPFPAWLAWLTAVNLLLTLFTNWYCAVYCAVRYRLYARSMITAALLYPFYLLLHSIASYKALWQLIVKPHFWEKTTHGLAGRFALPPRPEKAALAREIPLTST